MTVKEREIVYQGDFCDLSDFVDRARAAGAQPGDHVEIERLPSHPGTTMLSFVVSDVANGVRRPLMGDWRRQLAGQFPEFDIELGCPCQVGLPELCLDPAHAG